MISVIICSVNPTFLAQVSDDINRTIGVACEILNYDNRTENAGICSVYNRLARQALFDCLCFVHEDVLFQTQNWGRNILEAFEKDKDLGVVGLAGAKYKSAFFSGWFTGVQALDCAHYQHQYSTHLEKIFLAPDKSKKHENVVCVDGVFICCRKTVWEKILFNEKKLKGFHFYDLDFSLRAAKIYRLAIDFEISLTHITSGGDYGDKWIDEAINFHYSNSQSLPFPTEEKFKQYDLQIAKNNLDFLKNFKISSRNRLRWVKLQKLYLYPGLYYSVTKFLIYRPLGLRHLHKLFKST